MIPPRQRPSSPRNVARRRARLEARACTGKTRYSARTARLAAADARQATRERVSPYRCPFCHAWHIGHVPSMRKVRNMAQVIRERAYPPTDRTTRGEQP